MSSEAWEPCLVCGAPVNEGGAGHDEGCPVMPTDIQIAADMALAAAYNRESWEDLPDDQYAITRLTHYRIGSPQPVNHRTSAPLYLLASETARRREPVWILED